MKPATFITIEHNADKDKFDYRFENFIKELMYKLPIRTISITHKVEFKDNMYSINVCGFWGNKVEKVFMYHKQNLLYALNLAISDLIWEYMLKTYQGEK